ncbi:MAG: uncharacterized protein KVP18_004523 [Porospora cf. gigantea A]|uniref:uncharacterized protein n=1 Tax=Porospora cf. gigantea A TaxID=2853593 RepID=UPI00355A9450|nr:MAG: hypothetical protein KVP18_004523 [Porospora cf. gigantea A]
MWQLPLREATVVFLVVSIISNLQPLILGNAVRLEDLASEVCAVLWGLAAVHAYVNEDWLCIRETLVLVQACNVGRLGVKGLLWLTDSLAEPSEFWTAIPGSVLSVLSGVSVWRIMSVAGIVN